MTSPATRALALTLALVLLRASLAMAEEAPDEAPPDEAPPGQPEVLWSVALLAEARGAPAEELDALRLEACEAGSVEACRRGAASALEETDLDDAEEWIYLAREAAPDDEELHLAQARLMAAVGNSIWAARELQALESAGREVSFERGYVLRQLGEHELALEPLGRSAAGSGEEAPFAALLAASSLEELGRLDEATRLAEQAADAEGDDAVARAGRALRRELRRRGAQDRTLIGGWATVALRYDSNPVLSPDEASTQPGGVRLGMRAGLAGEPLGGRRWALGAAASISRNQSFADEARPFDDTFLAAQAHLRLRLGRRAPQELLLGYRYLVGWLDGGQGVEEDELYAYNEAHTGSLAYSLALTPRLTTRLRAEGGWSVYHNRARTGLPLSFAVGQGATFLEGHLKVYVELALQMAWTRNDRYNQRGFTVRGALAYLTPLWRLELLLALSSRFTHYPDSRGVGVSFDYAQPELRRREAMTGLSLEVGRDLLDDHLRIALRYRLNDNAASITAFDYSRHQVELAVTGEF